MKNNIDKIVDNDYKIPGSCNPYSRIERFLRKSSIDEITQMINILSNETSLVGPRPIVDIDYYDDEEKKLLLSVKPGITGYWQVNGRNKIKYPERKKYELFCAKNNSIYFDLKIIFETIRIILKRDSSVV